MRFVDVQGNAGVLDGLWRAAREGRLAHALCFVGPEGVGKFLSAERLCAGLMCARGVGPPCGTCGPCKRLRTGSHPDVFVVDPTLEGLESIPIAWVTPRPAGPEQTIEQFLSLLPMEGGWRVVLVREADRLVEEAQNALLKTLEEPGESTLLVLETARPDRLLPTIHSRCVRVPFRSLSLAEVRDVLEHSIGAEGLTGGLTGGLTRARAETLARWSQGAPGAALALHARSVIEMRDILERALAPGADPFALARALAEVDGDFPGKTVSARARVRARTFLDLTGDVLRDALRVTASLEPGGLAHGDLARHLGSAGESALASSLERILAARQDVDANLAPDAAIERALLALEPLRSTPMPGSRR